MLPSHLSAEDIKKPIPEELPARVERWDFHRMINRFAVKARLHPEWRKIEVRYELAGVVLDNLPPYQTIKFSYCLFWINTYFGLPTKQNPNPETPYERINLFFESSEDSREEEEAKKIVIYSND